MQHTLVSGNHVRVQLLHYAQPQVVLPCRDEQLIKVYMECGLQQGQLVQKRCMNHDGTSDVVQYTARHAK